MMRVVITCWGTGTNERVWASRLLEAYGSWRSPSACGGWICYADCVQILQTVCSLSSSYVLDGSAQVCLGSIPTWMQNHCLVTVCWELGKLQQVFPWASQACILSRNDSLNVASGAVMHKLRDGVPIRHESSSHSVHSMDIATGDGFLRILDFNSSKRSSALRSDADSSFGPTTCFRPIERHPVTSDGISRPV